MLDQMAGSMVFDGEVMSDDPNFDERDTQKEWCKD